MFQDWTYREAGVQLHPGDVVRAYTDGVTEAANRVGEEWGVQAPSRSLPPSVVERNAPKTPLSEFSAMDAFSHGCQTDDATVAVLQVH